jgi:protein-disulfide isomerase
MKLKCANNPQGEAFPQQRHAVRLSPAGSYLITIPPIRLFCGLIFAMTPWMVCSTPGQGEGTSFPATSSAVEVHNPTAQDPKKTVGATKVAAESGLNARANANVEATQGPSGELDSYLGMPVGFTGEGYPFLGDPKAPVTLEEFSDYLCPFCGRYFQQTFPQLVERYVRKGHLKYVFRDLPLASLHPTAPQGPAAAICVAEQGAALFWAMHDALFRAQSQWSRLPDPGNFLADLVEKVGADRQAYEQCLASGRADALVQTRVAEGQALRFNGTPSFRFITAQGGEAYTLVGALPVDAYARVADPLIAGEQPPEEPKPPQPELPSWARPEGLTPDPARLGFTAAGDPYKGNPEAPLVVVEFTDFQCPACKRHALETQPELDSTFVDTGRVLWVAKHSPLKMHARAPVAAAAAECAGDQGQFWEMRHALFEQADSWSAEAANVDGELIRLAQQLPLDMPEFIACFQGRGALERVLQDLYDAQGVAQQTPTFVLLKDGTGAVTRGAKSADAFAALLHARLGPKKDEVREQENEATGSGAE